MNDLPKFAGGVARMIRAAGEDEAYGLIALAVSKADGQGYIVERQSHNLTGAAEMNIILSLVYSLAERNPHIPQLQHLKSVLSELTGATVKYEGPSHG